MLSSLSEVEIDKDTFPGHAQQRQTEHHNCGKKLRLTGFERPELFGTVFAQENHKDAAHKQAKNIGIVQNIGKIDVAVKGNGSKLGKGQIAEAEHAGIDGFCLRPAFSAEKDPKEIDPEKGTEDPQLMRKLFKLGCEYALKYHEQAMGSTPENKSP